jgi:sodium-dependent phosphate cotransporter
MGANIGTTVTGILAALAKGDPAGLAIAFVHTLFNITGVVIFLPIRRIRNIPVDLARRLASLTLRSRWYALVYVGGMFFVLPVLGLFGWKWIAGALQALAGQ